jgi:hypothetical protein
LKRIALLAVIGASLLALPSSASARSDCAYTATPVYGSAVPDAVDNGETGINGAAVGACADVVGFGGYAEVGAGGSYGVVDGSDNNPANAAGYAGFNNGGVADSDPDPTCDGVDADPDAPAGDFNKGGCFWFKPTGTNVTALVPLTGIFFCGNTSGPDFAASPRDGCSVP